MDEIDAVVRAVRATEYGVAVRISFPRAEPPLVTERDHVVQVQRLDVGRGLGGPVCDYRLVAQGGERLVTELPGEDGSAIPVASDQCPDVVEAAVKEVVTDDLYRPSPTNSSSSAG